MRRALASGMRRWRVERVGALLLLGCAGGGSSEPDAPPPDARPPSVMSQECGEPEHSCDAAVPDAAGPATVTITIDLDGDCLEVMCPPEAPFVLGCDVDFEGNDPRGCVALLEDGHGLYYQEGDDCDAGHLSGTMTCGSVAGAPLSPALCPINKPDPIYAPSPSYCPDPI